LGLKIPVSRKFLVPPFFSELFKKAEPYVLATQDEGTVFHSSLYVGEGCWRLEWVAEEGDSEGWFYQNP
jgi:hypothetical protein